MAYITTQDIIRDVLFRTGEPPDGDSEFSTPAVALRYVNRAYDTLQMGGGELDPSISIDWYWLRSGTPGVLQIIPEVATTVTFFANDTTITFPALADTSRSLLNAFVNVVGESVLYRIAVHTAGATVATLLSGFIGASGAKTARFMQVHYNLDATCLRLMGSMRIYAANGQAYRVHGTDLETMEEEYPLPTIQAGVPQYYAALRESISGVEKVRFNTSGNASGGAKLQLEYEYVKRPAQLTNADGEEPRVPLEHRKLLADIAAWLIFVDKDDSRALITKEVAMQGIRAMSEEHWRRERRFSLQREKLYPYLRGSAGVATTPGQGAQQQTAQVGG